MDTIRNDEDGFTLGELLAVIVVLGVLMAIAIPSFLNWYREPIKATMKSDLKNAVTQIRLEQEMKQELPGKLPEQVRASPGNTINLDVDMLLDDPQRIDKSTPTMHFAGKRQGGKPFEFGMLSEYVAGDNNIKVAFADRSNDGEKYLRGVPQQSPIYNNFVIYKLHYTCSTPGSTATQTHMQHVGYGDNLYTTVTVQEVNPCPADQFPVPGSYRIAGYSDPEIKELIRDTNYGGNVYYTGQSISLMPTPIDKICVDVSNPKVPEDFFKYNSTDGRITEGSCGGGVGEEAPEPDDTETTPPAEEAPVEQPAEQPATDPNTNSGNNGNNGNGKGNQSGAAPNPEPAVEPAPGGATTAPAPVEEAPADPGPAPPKENQPPEPQPAETVPPSTGNNGNGNGNGHGNNGNGNGHGNDGNNGNGNNK